VNSISPLFAWLLVVLTLGIAAYFGRQLLKTSAWLNSNPELSPEDERYFRRQVVRRWIGCILLAAIGLMIAGYYLSGLDDWATKIEGPIEKPEDQRMKNIFLWYWMVVLLLLLLLMIVAAMDYWAIRGYGARHMKRIKEDRRAMIEHELGELRKAKGNRNGLGNGRG
jgi:hypothetical protein